jgi:lipooligosaccharide transport system permease protein
MPRLPTTLAVWYRDFLSWRRYVVSFVVSALGGPIFYLVAIGYGVGRFVGDFGGVDYATFLAPGLVATAAMNSASFEATFGAYTRMAEQDTYTAILATPCAVADVIAGDTLWAATKATFAVAFVVLVVTALGLMRGPWLPLLPVVGFVAGLTFGALGMVVTALARSYQFFEYYFTLGISVMFVFSGVFYPLDTLPPWARTVAAVSPLTHAVDAARLVSTGAIGAALAGRLAVLLVVAVAAFGLATRLVERRLLD